MPAWQTKLEVYFRDVRAGQAVFAGATELRALARLVRNAKATAAGTTALRATARLVKKATATAAGTTTLTAAAHLTQKARATLASTTTLTPTPHLRKTTKATLASSTTLDARANRVLPTLYHIIIVGQSNANGGGGSLGRTTTTIAKGRKFAQGENPGTVALTSLVPYTGADSTVNSANTIAETMLEWLGNNLPGNNLFLVTNVGWGGQTYFNIKKGTSFYNASIAHVSAAKNLAASLGYTYAPLALCSVHGEQDTTNGTIQGDYAAHMVEWYNDYNSDIASVMGSAVSIPIFHTQQAGVAAVHVTPPFDINDANRGMYAASISDPNKCVLVGPRFLYDNVDSLHVSNAGQRKMGECYARAIYRKKFDSSWTPFIAVSAVRTGLNVDITFTCPVPPLKFDFTNVSYSILDNYAFGFSWYDSTASAKVVFAAITGTNTVRVTLNNAPTGSSPMIQYANKIVHGSLPWRLGGSPYRGNLCDSDPLIGRYTIANFCPQFDIPVT